MNWRPDDTIAAPATPSGEGGLAVLRVSGPNALPVADRVFRAGSGGPKPSEARSHTVHYGRLWLGDEPVDEVLLTVFRAPRTFTREDTVEVSCHGGSLVVRRCLQALLAAGARLAEPGEFTQRAFLNGRLDLSQAEAVGDVIRARTDLALKSAQRQLAGAVSRPVESLRAELMNLLAHVEAQLDFPDEDIAPDQRARLVERLAAARGTAQRLRADARNGEILRQGARVALVGRPNAGKSSLLNSLLGRDRAIVAATPGTTRDTLEAWVDVQGVPMILVDTAGLRAAADPVEAEGVRRSASAAATADLVVWVIDASAPEDSDDLPPGGLSPLVAFNKSDLPPARLPPPGLEVIAISCATGGGLDALRAAMAARVKGGDGSAGDGDLWLGARHSDALQRTIQCLDAATVAFATEAPLDLAALDLRAAVRAVGEIAGHTSTDDLLDAIFSQFCLGK